MQPIDTSHFLTKHISFSMTEADNKALKRVALYQSLSLAEVIRRMIRKGVLDYNEKEKNKWMKVKEVMENTNA